MFINILSPMKNRILSVIVGVLVGWLIVGLGDLINASVFPVPADLDYKAKDELKMFIDSLPILALLSMLIVFAVSAFVGGLVSGVITKTNWQRVALTTGTILMLANIANMLIIPHPLWFNLVSIILYLPLSFLGSKIVN